MCRHFVNVLDEVGKMSNDSRLEKRQYLCRLLKVMEHDVAGELVKLVPLHSSHSRPESLSPTAVRKTSRRKEEEGSTSSMA